MLVTRCLTLLDQALAGNTQNGAEGHTGGCKEAIDLLQSIVLSLPPNARILEIGFNSGHSSCIMLSTRSDVSVVSFDLGYHDYVLPAKRIIDKEFPNRHLLILGDSRQTVPLVHGTFDMFFIDGGHDYSVAKQDYNNVYAIAQPGNIIVIDDVVTDEKNAMHYTVGPTCVWEEACKSNQLDVTNVVNFGPGRGIAYGTKLT